MTMRNNRAFKRMGVLSFLTVFVLSFALAQPGAKGSPRRWTEAKARAWAGAEPWALGCNYIPRTAVNTL